MQTSSNCDGAVRVWSQRGHALVKALHLIILNLTTSIVSWQGDTMEM